MAIGNSTEWLANISKVCRQMTEQSIVALRDAQGEHLGQGITLEAAKKVLVAHFERLEELLPADFPESRTSDLARHLHFCQQGDCIDIAAFDIPDILEKAEQYAQQHSQQRPSGEVGDYIHPFYRARLDREIVSAEPDYHALILKSAVILGDVFKEKAGATDDKDAEIGKALRVDGPTVKIMTDLTNETSRNFQRGTMLLLQGVRAFYRNTYAHGQIDAKQRDAVRALILISLLTELLQGATPNEE